MTYPTASKIPAAPGSPISTSAASWDDIARLCRRICLLRERGDEIAAETLTRDALAPALAAYRFAAGENDTAIDVRLHATFEIERERVANATVLAELLAPLLREQVDATMAANVSAQKSAGEASALQPNRAAAPPPPAPMRHEPADIADFIDEMLAQERPAKPARRAS